LRARDPFSILREERPGAVASPWRESQPAHMNFDAAPLFGSDHGLPGTASSDLVASEAPQSLRARILDLLGPAPISLDELVRAAEAPISEVRIVLLELDLAGRLEHAGGARVSLSPPQENR
jgi:DNA processing protein